jgi:DNA polymerase-1
LESPSAGRDLSYKGLNVLIQGSAADQTKAAIISACRSMPRARLLTTVYDEINLSVPADEVEQHARLLRDAMVGALPLDVPVECDLEAGPNWAAIQPLGEAA